MEALTYFLRAHCNRTRANQWLLQKLNIRVKSLPLLDERATLYIHDHVSTVPIYVGTHWGPSYSHVLLVSTCLHSLLMAI